MEAAVDGVDAIVSGARLGVRLVGTLGRRLRGRDRGIDIRKESAGDRREQGSAACGDLAGVWNADREPGDVGEELHQQRARGRDAAARDDLPKVDPVLGEVLDDAAVTERDPLEERAVDMLTCGM